MNNNFFETFNFDAGTRRSPVYFPAHGKIIYLSSDGSEDNDGLSTETPRYDIKRVPEYLKEGFSVLLKAESVWYVPNLAWKIVDTNATEESPLVVGTYGHGRAPVVADMRVIYGNEWKCEHDGIYSASVVGDVVRFYINDKIYPEVETIQELTDESFFRSGERVYIRTSAVPDIVEYHSFVEGIKPETTVFFKNAGYITLQNFIIKGGAGWSTIFGEAPTDHFAFDHMEIRSMFRYCASIGADEEDPNAYNDSFSFTNSIIDRTWSEAAFNCFRTDMYAKTRTTDGIYMRKAHIGAYIAGNIIRDYGHTGINMHASDKFAGIHNCIIERNLISGTGSAYFRACETIGPDGMCTGNIVRYNCFYDLTNSCHLMGENNKYYCNVFAYITPTKASNTVQPYAIDSMTWKQEEYEFVARGNIIANNTIYNCAAALAFKGNNYRSTVVNNLIVGWNYPGAVRMEETKEEISFFNNCFYSEENENVLYRKDEEEDFKVSNLNSMPKSSGNIFVSPEFNGVENNDFSISPDSPCAAAGMPISRFIDIPYTDINGVEFDPEHPSIGAFSAKKH